MSAVHAQPRSTDRMLRRLRGEVGIAFFTAGIVTLFVNLGMLFVPLYDMILYDRVLQSRNMDTITMLSVGVVVGMTIYGVLEYCRSAIFVVIADRLGRRLNIPTLQAAVAKTLAGESSAGGQAIRDLDALRLFASGPAAAIPLDLLWTPGLIAVLYLLHPVYGLYGVACAAVLFLVSLLTDLTTREELLRANTETAAAVNDLSNALRNTELLDGMGMLPEVARRWTHRQDRALDVNQRATNRNKRFAAFAKTARLAMQAGVIALGVILVMRYEASPGSMMGANLLIAKLLLPLEQLIYAWRQWTSNLAGWRRIHALLADADVHDSQVVPAKIEGRLVVDRLRFTPAGAPRAILNDVSFSVEPGEAVAIVGPSGSGKSTLARLVMGIFAPSGGCVRLDGIDTYCWDRAEFGRQVGYLPQSIALLDGTILDNIARMRDEEPALAIAAAEKVGVHDLVGRLPEGYSTWIGGAGYALSGGQQQRIALARALYGRPKFLVLDEPNSNLDHAGEQSLIQVLEEAKHSGIAVLMITHRPAGLAAMDKIVHLNDGRVERVERPSADTSTTSAARQIESGATGDLAPA